MTLGVGGVWLSCVLVCSGNHRIFISEIAYIETLVWNPALLYQPQDLLDGWAQNWTKWGGCREEFTASP